MAHLKVKLRNATNSYFISKDLLIFAIFILFISLFFQIYKSQYLLAEEIASEQDTPSNNKSNQSDPQESDNETAQKQIDPKIIKALLEKLSKLDEEENYNEIIENIDKLENKDELLAEVDEIKDIYIRSLNNLLSQSLESNKPNWQIIENYASKIIEHINNHPLANYAMGLCYANKSKPNLSKALEYLSIAKKSKNAPKDISKVYWIIWAKKNLYYLIAILVALVSIPIVVKAKKTKQEKVLNDLNLPIQEIEESETHESSLQISTNEVIGENSKQTTKELHVSNKNEIESIPKDKIANLQLQDQQPIPIHEKANINQIASKSAFDQQPSSYSQTTKEKETINLTHTSSISNIASSTDDTKTTMTSSFAKKPDDSYRFYKSNKSSQFSSPSSNEYENKNEKPIDHIDLENKHIQSQINNNHQTSQTNEILEIDLQKALEKESETTTQNIALSPTINNVDQETKLESINIKTNFIAERTIRVPNDSDIEKRWQLLCKLASNSDIYEHLALESARMATTGENNTSPTNEYDDVKIDLSPEALKDNLIEKLQMLAITDNELRILLQQRKIEHLPALCEYILTKPDPVRLAYIARELGYYHDPAVTDILVGLLNHEDSRVVIAAIQGLQINGLNQDIIHICPFIQSSTPAIFEAARTALEHFGPKRILEAFLEISSYTDEKLRISAVYLLARMKGAKVTELLVKLLNSDPSTEVRKQVILSMALHKDPTFLPHLREYARKTKLEEEKKLLRRAIVYLQNIESALRGNKSSQGAIIQQNYHKNITDFTSDKTYTS